MFWLFAIIAHFFPILPIYLSGLGVTASQIAYLIAIHSLTALVSSQLVGYVADAMMKSSADGTWVSLEEELKTL